MIFIKWSLSSREITANTINRSLNAFQGNWITQKHFLDNQLNNKLTQAKVRKMEIEKQEGFPAKAIT